MLGRRAIPMTMLAVALTSCHGELDTRGGEATPRAATRTNGGQDAGQAASVEDLSVALLEDASAEPIVEELTPVLSAKIWKLTPEQLAVTAAALTGEGIETDLKIDLTARIFANEPEHLDLHSEHVGALGEFASEVVDRVLQRPELYAPCAAAEIDRACAERMIAEFGSRAWRRPMSELEVSAYLSGYDALLATPEPPDAALRTSLEALLASPHFLFRTELGPPEHQGQSRITLTSHERAQALSYLLTNGPPDEALRRAADDDALKDPAQLGQHARRLLEREEAPAGLVDFFMQLTGAHTVVGLAKDESRYPLWDYGISQLLYEETRRYLGYMLSKPETTFEALLTAGYSVLNAELAAYYGVPFEPLEELGDGWARVAMPEPYAGLLTQGSVMAVHARFEASDIVHRALFVYSRLLCRQAPELPEELDVNPVEPSETMTQRQTLAQHTKESECAVCHAVFDPLGFPLELLDGVGRARTMEAGQPIDPLGQISGFSAFDSPRTLSAQIGAHEEAHRCVSRRLADYALGRQRLKGIKEPVEDPVSQLVYEVFASQEGNVREALIELISHELFWTRENR